MGRHSDSFLNRVSSLTVKNLGSGILSERLLVIFGPSGNLNLFIMIAREFGNLDLKLTGVYTKVVRCLLLITLFFNFGVTLFFRESDNEVTATKNLFEQWYLWQFQSKVFNS